MLNIDQKIIEKISSRLSENDLDFFKRVWASPLDLYYTRLRALDLEGLNHVLDAGFGVGQWTMPLADMNSKVSGIEFDRARIQVVNDLIKEVGVTNIETVEGSIENLPYEDSTFDAVFCYSVVFQTDFRKSLMEFYRVLKPGGKIYLTANELGWYLKLIIENHNKSESYDPRVVGATTIKNTIDFLDNEDLIPGSQVIITQKALKKAAFRVGYSDVEVGPEGSICRNSNYIPKSFYAVAEYMGHPMIYEALLTK